MIINLYVKTKLAMENFISDNRGVTAIEYAIVGVAISSLVLLVFADQSKGLGLALTQAMVAISANVASAANITP